MFRCRLLHMPYAQRQFQILNRSSSSHEKLKSIPHLELAKEIKSLGINGFEIKYGVSLFFHSSKTPESAKEVAETLVAKKLDRELCVGSLSTAKIHADEERYYGLTAIITPKSYLPPEYSFIGGVLAITPTCCNQKKVIQAIGLTIFELDQLPEASTPKWR